MEQLSDLQTTVYIGLASSEDKKKNLRVVWPIPQRHNLTFCEACCLTSVSFTSWITETTVSLRSSSCNQEYIFQDRIEQPLEGTAWGCWLTRRIMPFSFSPLSSHDRMDVSLLLRSSAEFSFFLLFPVFFPLISFISRIDIIVQ